MLKITYIKAVILPQERSQREILITFSARIAHAFNYTQAVATLHSVTTEKLHKQYVVQESMSIATSGKPLGTVVSPYATGDRRSYDA